MFDESVSEMNTCQGPLMVQWLNNGAFIHIHTYIHTQEY